MPKTVLPTRDITHVINRGKCRALALGLCAALALPLAVQAEVDDLVRSAVALAEKGQGKEAFNLLDAKEPARAGDPDFDLIFGVAANQAEEYNRAIFALERVLVVQPGNARARAELGRALFSVGDTVGARRVLNETKEQGVPVEVAKTIDQFLSAIDRVDEAGRSSVKGYVEAGIGHDDNINGAPSSNIIAVPAFTALGFGPVTLSPAGTKTGASLTTLGAGVSGRFVIDSRWSLLGNASASFRWNGDPASPFNSVQGNLGGGASYRVDANEYTVSAMLGTYDVGGRRVRDQVGLVGEWIHRLDGFRQISSYAQLSRLTYPGQSTRDAQRNVLGVAYAHLFRSGLLAFGGLYAGNESESSGNPQLGHNLTGLRGGLQKPFSESLAAFATVGYEERRFGGQDPLFLVTRNDRQTNFSLGMTWVPAKLWRVTPQISSTQASSNIAINEFSSQQVSVTVRREF